MTPANYSAAAVAAVLTSRLLTYWLPALPGIATFRYLQHHDIVWGPPVRRRLPYERGCRKATARDPGAMLRCRWEVSDGFHHCFG